MYAATRLITDQLTDAEFLAIYQAALLDYHPQRVNGYEKAQKLFTDQDGTRMHQATKEMLGIIFSERFPAGSK